VGAVDLILGMNLDIDLGSYVALNLLLERDGDRSAADGISIIGSSLDLELGAKP